MIGKNGEYMTTLPRRIVWKSYLAALVVSVLFALLGVGRVAYGKSDDKLTQDDVRHLLNRTGFAASMADINALAGLSRRQAADKLLAATREVAITPPPAWVTTPITPATRLRDMTPEERQAELRLNNERAIELREWW
ncbi:MAG: hypothetical protein ACKO15_15820, partial [Burkholderiales bacterium]